MSEIKGGSSNNWYNYYTAHYCFCLCMHGQNSICKFNQFLRGGGGKDLHGEAKAPPEINPDYATPLEPLNMCMLDTYALKNYLSTLFMHYHSTLEPNMHQSID